MLIFYGQIMARDYHCYTTKYQARKAEHSSLLTEGGIGLIEYHL